MGCRFCFQESVEMKEEEFGVQVSLQNKSSLFSNLDKNLDIWMSWRQSDFFTRWLRDGGGDNSPIAAFENGEKIFGLSSILSNTYKRFRNYR